MSIPSISGQIPLFTSVQGASASSVAKPATEERGESFASRMQGAVREVALAQTKASESARGFQLGTRNDLASVMVDQQVASLGFQMTLQVRNKALGAYRDIMNMPV